MNISILCPSGASIVKLLVGSDALFPPLFDLLEAHTLKGYFLFLFALFF